MHLPTHYVSNDVWNRLAAPQLSPVSTHRGPLSPASHGIETGRYLIEGVNTMKTAIGIDLVRKRAETTR